VSTTTPTARFLAEAVESLLVTLLRQRRPARDPEPGELSMFQSLMLTAIVDRRAVRLGALAAELGTTDATTSRTVDILEVHGLATRRPAADDGRGVLVEATAAGKSEVGRRRRRLIRLAERALADLTAEEASRVTAALAELRVLLDRH